MKNKQYRLSQMLHHLRHLQNQGKKSVVWKLTKEQRIFLEEHFFIEPYLYVIKTKKFIRIKDKEPIIKDVHYAYKRGKKELVRTLNKSSDRRILDENDVYYRPCKFMIHLNQ